MSTKTLLEVDNLSVTLPAGGDREFAVTDLSCTLCPNEILCVVGESGSGKSVFARSIMGLLPVPRLRVSGGSIRFDGQDLVNVAPSEMRRIRGNKISMIFQEPMTALNPLIRVGKQMEEVLCVHASMGREERRSLITGRLQRVGITDPERLLRSYPHELSGGQRQRAMIAMALLLEPRILVADEPTTALDVTTQAKILRLIKDIQASSHMAVIFITHDFGVVAELADRVAVMQQGRLVEIGNAKDVLEHPSHPYTRSLMEAVPRMKFRGPRTSFDKAPAVLSAQALCKAYRASRRSQPVHALKDVSLRIRRGEAVGVVGESGSGKSTLARSIARLVDVDAGQILLGDTDLLRLEREPLREIRSKLQMVFQDPFASLDPRCKVGFTVAEGLLAHGETEENAMRRTDELLSLVGLGPDAKHRFPHEFSGGQRQRIAIARALALGPELLIADEPVSALDVSMQAQVLKLLADIKERLHFSMLFITHDLRVASQVCDYICVMRNGEIVEHGQTQDVFADPRHEYTRELLSAVPGLAHELSAAEQTCMARIGIARSPSTSEG